MSWPAMQLTLHRQANVDHPSFRSKFHLKIALLMIFFRKTIAHWQGLGTEILIRLVGFINISTGNQLVKNWHHWYRWVRTDVTLNLHSFLILES